MTDLAPSGALLLVIWGTLVGLDLVSVPQAMIARPVVAGAVAGWLAGDVEAGLRVGVLFELFALDVLPVEPPTAEHPAPAWPRLIVTPHVAWYSAEAEEACVTRPVLSVRAVLDGREPEGAVNRP